ncbi:hypothetical protein AOLI_G00009390 [Acnodon oligacanthus]
MVPIFSSSRSVVRDLVFPEVEELIEMNIEDDNSPIRVMAHFSNQPERAQPMPHLFNMGNKAQEPFVVQQDHVQYTASISKRECLNFSIKQSDMCLVCIAFASWILKSYNPQSTDMWKAALLANVSAISAIQYLRKYVKKDATEDDS